MESVFIDTVICPNGFPGVYDGMLHAPASNATLAAFSGTSCIYRVGLTAVVLTLLEVRAGR